MGNRDRHNAGTCVVIGRMVVENVRQIANPNTPKKI